MTKWHSLAELVRHDREQAMADHDALSHPIHSGDLRPRRQRDHPLQDIHGEALDRYRQASTTVRWPAVDEKKAARREPLDQRPAVDGPYPRLLEPSPGIMLIAEECRQEPMERPAARDGQRVKRERFFIDRTHLLTAVLSITPALIDGPNSP